MLAAMDMMPPPLPPGQTPMGQDSGMRMILPVGRSVWAILAGYFGLFSVIPVFAPAALICGIVAIIHIRKSKLGSQPKFGMGRAIFGVVMGTLGTLALLALIWAYVFDK